MTSCPINRRFFSCYGSIKQFVLSIPRNGWFWVTDRRLAFTISASAYAEGIGLRRRACRGVGGWAYTRTL